MILPLIVTAFNDHLAVESSIFIGNMAQVVIGILQMQADLSQAVNFMRGAATIWCGFSAQQSQGSRQRVEDPRGIGITGKDHQHSPNFIPPLVHLRQEGQGIKMQFKPSK